MLQTVNRFKLVLIWFTIAISSCTEFFDYSPYAANVKSSYKHTQEKNLKRLYASDSITKTEFKFAVLADSHFHYNNLDKIISKINRRQDIDFVIVNGDITNNGYLKEYELFHNQMDNLDIPYLTVIGNHDYKSNGEKIYKEIYGKRNCTFNYNNNLYVIFDNIVWESNNSPDFDWLRTQLEDSDKFENVFVVCHQPPYTSQFTLTTEKVYKELMLEYQVDLSIHGHIHSFEHEDYYKDGINYLAVGPVSNNEFAIITVNESNVLVQSIEL